VEPSARRDTEPPQRCPRMLGEERWRGVPIAELARVRRGELVALEGYSSNDGVVADRFRERHVAEDRVAAIVLAIIAEPARTPVARERAAHREEHARVEDDSADRAAVGMTRVVVAAEGVKIRQTRARERAAAPIFRRPSAGEKPRRTLRARPV